MLVLGSLTDTTPDHVSHTVWTGMLFVYGPGTQITRSASAEDAPLLVDDEIETPFQH